MPKLRILNLNVNRITGPNLRRFLDAYIKNAHINNNLLESLSLSQNQLREDGISDLFERLS